MNITFWIDLFSHGYTIVPMAIAATCMLTWLHVARNEVYWDGSDEALGFMVFSFIIWGIVNGAVAAICSMESNKTLTHSMWLASVLVGDVIGTVMYFTPVGLRRVGKKITAHNEKLATERQAQEAEEAKRQDPTWVLEETKDKLTRAMPLIEAHAKGHLAWVQQISKILTYLVTRIPEAEQAASSGPSNPARHDVGIETNELAEWESKQLDSYRRMTRFLYDLSEALPRATRAAREDDFTPMESAQKKFEEACQEWLTRRDRTTLRITDSPQANFPIISQKDERTPTDAVLAASGVPKADWETEAEEDSDGPHRPAKVPQKQR